MMRSHINFGSYIVQGKLIIANEMCCVYAPCTKNDWFVLFFSLDIIGKKTINQAWCDIALLCCYGYFFSSRRNYGLIQCTSRVIPCQLNQNQKIFLGNHLRFWWKLAQILIYIYMMATCKKVLSSGDKFYCYSHIYTGGSFLFFTHDCWIWMIACFKMMIIVVFFKLSM